MFKGYDEFLNETRGVPENIGNVAATLFDKILAEKFDNTNGEDLNELEVKFKGPFQIGNRKVKNIIIELAFEVYPHVEGGIQIARLGQMNQGKVGSLPATVGKTGKIHPGKMRLENLETSDIHILIHFVADKNVKGKEIKKFLELRRAKTISELAHELQHGYEAYKRGHGKLSRKADYAAYSEIEFSLPPLSFFMHSLYFTHETENLVRASEVSTEMKELGITKKEFLKFINSNETYKTLKKIRDTTYDSFRKEILEHIDTVKEWLESNKFQLEGKSDDAIIDDMLRSVYFKIVEAKGEALRNILVPGGDNPFAAMMHAMSTPHEEKARNQEFFEKFMKKSLKFEKDPLEFYKTEISKASKSAVETMKRISKLYADAPDTNESILNWDLWHKINKKTKSFGI